jgi:signal transduction histidine kinase
MPQFNGLRALELQQIKFPDIPFILVSGTIGEDVAVEAIKQGASDYLLKDRLVRLGPAIVTALKQRHLRDERRKLEEQFRQAQKMEAIGQLSGGVAHDFNNLLTVIQMHSSIMQFNIEFPMQVRESAKEIGRASERAANLTRQLLTFSRRRNLQLGDLSLNDVVTNIAKMLQRILGEDIHMELHYWPRPIFIHADAGMMDQILLNLAVNSRDAMPQGGRLIIETSAVEVTEEDLENSPEGREGSFALLSVTDTGCGIPPELVSRIFEPFFTTKDIGKGTGLGLATLYGIVQQHHGWIELESEVGRGTTFRVYLPRRRLILKKKTTQHIPKISPRGSETILVVEDDATLRLLVSEVLESLGYRVIEASSGQQAMETWNQAKDDIHLLLTDLIMPNGLSGVDLARNLTETHPDLKVIYTSGYSKEIAGKDHSLQEGVNFLAKPYYPNQLAQAVRARLDS